ncbi:TRAP transporter substrate-binding protein [Nitratireductor soli]|uniref:TRAP transporter substrate-binding protein n=1 Tax=Nitratireductor soli TaxID=1670619 RepID=UPI000AB2626E|nr:TRAP transporter substrate-binding protein [Nitratireductor soli]
MNRRELLKLAAALPATAAFPYAARAETLLRMSSWLPPQHVLHKDVMQVWAKEVTEASNGRLRINTLPKPVTAPPGTFDAVADGIVEIAFNVHGYTPGRFVATNIAEFPGAGDSAEAASVAYQRVYDKHMAQHGEHGDLKVLAVFTNGPGHIFNSKRPIARLEDLQNLRVRVGGGIVNELADLLGVSAVLKPASESYELMSAGIVDGLFFPVEPIITFKLDRLVRYGTLIPGGLYNTSWAVVMNKAAFDKLAAEDQEAIEKVSGEHLARLAGKTQDKNDAHALELVNAAGIEMITADAAFMGQIEERMKPLQEAWLKKVEARGVDGAQLLRAWGEELAGATNG